MRLFRVCLVFFMMLGTICSPAYTDYYRISSDPDQVYELLNRKMAQGEWEDSRDIIEYLKLLVTVLRAEERFPDIPSLEERVESMVASNLDRMYDEALSKEQNSDLLGARKICRKILYYRQDQRAKELLGRIRSKLGFVTEHVSSAIPERPINGLRVLDRKRCYRGYVLLAHHPCGKEKVPEFPVYLLDVEGTVVWQWMLDSSSAIVRLKPSGILSYSDCSNILEVDPWSRTLWRHHGLIDHSFQFLDGGEYLVNRRNFIDGGVRDENMMSDEEIHIEIVDRENNPIWAWKGEEHMDEIYRYTGIRFLPKERTLWANSNYAEIIGKNALSDKDPRFKEGNIIFSLNVLNTIGIIDRATGDVVWAYGPGEISGQHTPTMLENGNILIFDNGLSAGFSRVIEVDPLKEDIVWEYTADPKEGFFTNIMGNCMRLPNGNTFICDSESNRLFEVTPGGDLVWDYISSYNTKSATGHIFHAFKYSPEHVRELLRQKGK